MDIGVSSYSLLKALKSNELTVDGMFEWIKENEGTHVEIVPHGFEVSLDTASEIYQQAQKAGLEISNYAIGANFAVEDEDQYRTEIERVKKHVDIANALGAKHMRHDAASRTGGTITTFINDLDRIADACREITEYATTYGIVTSIENHGLYLQGSDRVIALIDRVNHPNFRLTLDVGNFVCADEDTYIAVKKCLPYASMVHIKDFYVREEADKLQDGWIQTSGGKRIRGSIIGQGDLPIKKILHNILESNYDSWLSIEFEGMENSQYGTAVGLQYVDAIINKEVR
ncbi:sugar phosphate isomerase/epimerase family protein [Gracilibacillus kekensis]|uniref:Sugar phosphate isomerase/epimerase n=1 Tax=Gracilibacillus kekensis TaxID=1027249 RepID=A0A1M7QSJ6_9BACI|nr:sugar phosphate isomerase/epimerase family protein [Gracilibacillus kekensis]SHN34636.1 Sugar phosphate isomerase/epimerase [Gracilibacillus kekensis]